MGSYFALKAGAKRVYAVEGSALAFDTKAVVEENGLSDRLIVYHARMEDVELPEKVDTIVSEWMGACLIFESMLGSVLFARDKWLKKEECCIRHDRQSFSLRLKPMIILRRK